MHCFTRSTLRIPGIATFALILTVFLPVLASAVNATLQPNQGQVGTGVTATGAGWPPGTGVLIYFQNQLIGGPVTPDASGAFTTTFCLPQTSLPPGPYPVFFTNGRENFNPPFTITPGTGMTCQASTGQSQPSPGWYSNSGAGRTGSIILEDARLRITWENSYIYQHPGTDNLYWYAEVKYFNKSNQPIGHTCSGLANPSLVKEHIRGTEEIPPDGDGYVAAEETFCSRNPNFTGSLEPGGTHYSWAIFHNVPPGGQVRLEWGYPNVSGFSAWVIPWLSPFSAPQPAECPKELVTLKTCQPVSRTPEGKASNLVMLVHGCCTDANDVRNVWENFGRHIAGTIQPSEAWEIVVWDWHKHTPKDAAFWLLSNAISAYGNTENYRIPLAQTIAKYSYNYVHLIGQIALHLTVVTSTSAQ